MSVCSIHRFHVPAQPASPDDHHVIPRAWQYAWNPERGFSPSAAGLAHLREISQPPLWDDRTVPLCPNCHRSVHEAIVRLMKYPGTGAGRTRVQGLASQALSRFEAAGGDLDRLRSAKLYGYQ